MESVVFGTADRPDVEVLLDDDAWHDAELRAWVPRQGTWEAWVRYSLRPGHVCLVSVPPEQVRGVDERGALGHPDEA